MQNERYPQLKAAVLAPDGADMHALLGQLRSQGVYGLRSSELQAACTTILDEQGDELPEALRWWVKRLQNAGLPPSYPDYLGLAALTAGCDLTPGSPQRAQQTLRLIHDLWSHLLEVPELQDHPRRAMLECRTAELLEVCRTYIFCRVPADGPAGWVVALSLVPESAVRDELIFLRVVQSTELVFDTATTLAGRAIEGVAYSHALEALVALHWMACLERLLLPLLRLLAPMGVEQWLAFRPLIVQPSAIQSMSFHGLVGQLNELNRILDHPRYPAEQRRYVPACRELLDHAMGELQTWYRAHTQIAAKYGQATRDFRPEGVRWLEKQRLVSQQNIQ